MLQFVQMKTAHKNVALGYTVEVATKLPLSLIGIYYGSTVVSKTITGWSGPFAVFLNHWCILVIAVTLTLTVLLEKWLNRPKGDEQAAKAAISLLTCITEVVRIKARRFSDKLNEFKASNTTDPKEIFLAITQPKAQINVLAQMPVTYFTSIAPDCDFSSRLVEIQDGRPIRFITYHPMEQIPRSEMADLGAPGTALTHAINKKTLIIIEECKKESTKIGGKYKITCDAQNEEDGSLLCYPITHPASRQVVCVLCVNCNKPRYFKRKNQEIYKDILGEIGLRIQLEYCLQDLKQTVEGLNL